MNDLIKSLRQPMFASRDTIEEAYEYMEMVAKATNCPSAVITACQVVVNTICKELEKYNGNQTGEYVGTVKYLGQAKKSELENIVESWVRA